MGREVTLQHVLVLIFIFIFFCEERTSINWSDCKWHSSKNYPRKNDGRGSGIFNFTRNNKDLIIIDPLKHYLIFQQEGHGGKLARWRARAHALKSKTN